MPQPIWRELAQVRVPERPSDGVVWQWTMALEQVGASKLMKLEVVVDPADPTKGRWKPRGFLHTCTADGDFQKTEKADGKLLPTAPCGALIARIGGSAADQPIVTEQTTVPSSNVIFSVGRKCIFKVADSAIGSLYLAPNVPLTLMALIEGDLVVSVSEAL